MNEFKIYLARHGKTFFNLEDRLGGDSELTQEGFENAEKISEYLKNINLEIIYSSKLKRSIQTAEILHKHHANIPLIQKQELNELSAGDIDGLSYTEFEKKYPGLYKLRDENKYYWCFPNGESYATALPRVKVVLDEIKSQKKDVAIVGHQAIIRVILGYLLDIPKTKSPYLNTPNDALFIIEPNTKKVNYIQNEKRYEGYIVK